MLFQIKKANKLLQSLTWVKFMFGSVKVLIGFNYMKKLKDKLLIKCPL